MRPVCPARRIGYVSAGVVELMKKQLAGRA